MMKRKDILLIVLVLVLAAAMLGISKLLPKTDLSTKTADVTLAPDAIEYVEATPVPTAEPTEAPVVTEVPTAEPTEAPVVTEVPTAEPTEAPVVTEAPTAEPTEAPTAEHKQ